MAGAGDKPPAIPEKGRARPGGAWTPASGQAPGRSAAAQPTPAARDSWTARNSGPTRDPAGRRVVRDARASVRSAAAATSAVARIATAATGAAGPVDWSSMTAGRRLRGRTSSRAASGRPDARRAWPAERFLHAAGLRRLQRAQLIGQRLPFSSLGYNIPDQYRYRFMDNDRFTTATAMTGRSIASTAGRGWSSIFPLLVRPVHGPAAADRLRRLQRAARLSRLLSGQQRLSIPAPTAIPSIGSASGDAASRRHRRLAHRQRRGSAPSASATGCRWATTPTTCRSPTPRLLRQRPIDDRYAGGDLSGRPATRLVQAIISLLV